MSFHPRLRTGYFGIPGRANPRALVHLVETQTGGERPIPWCGQPITKRAVFQECTHGPEDGIVECAKCNAYFQHREKVAKVGAQHFSAAFDDMAIEFGPKHARAFFLEHTRGLEIGPIGVKIENDICVEGGKK